MPAISPNAPGASSYTITGSKAFVANPVLDFNNVQRTLTVTFPNPDPADLSLELVRLTAPGGSRDLITLAEAGTADDTSIPGRTLTATKIPGQLTCTIHDPSEAGVIDELYELRVRANVPVTWTLSVDNPTNTDVLLVACDPVASFNGLAPELLERDELTLTANDALGLPATPTVVRDPTHHVLTPPAPGTTYRFDHDGQIVIMGLASPVSPSNAYHLVKPDNSSSLLPTVYGDTPVPMTVDVTYTGIGGTPGFLSAQGIGNTKIVARPQQAVLVLDRSGSMLAEHRYDNAKTAAILFTNLFGEFRANANSSDAIGIAVFEDPACAFRAGPPTPAPFVDDIVDLDKPDQVAANIGTAPFGVPGACTNIGEGLAKGLAMLQAHGMPDDARYLVALMTDGDENSGPVKVGPGPDPSGAISWAQRITQPDVSDIASDPQLNLYTIGLGSAPNFPVLSNLSPKGNFAAIFSIGELIDGFATMLQVAQDINKLTTRFTRVSGDPVPANPTEVFFDTTSAERFGVGVLKRLDPPTPADVIDGVEIAKWNSGTNQFDVQSLAASPFDGHFYIGVPNAPAFGSGTQTWRIRRLNGTTPQPIALNDVLAYEDLHIQSELTLDRKDYQTGEDMKLFVRVRHNSAPVLRATVRAELDAPEEGLGTLLSSLTDEDLKHKSKARKDRPKGKAALIDAVLGKYDWRDLPRCNPAPGSGLFVDGTNLLHDVDGDGTYSNTFAKVDKEGVYNWTLVVDGVDTDGNTFSHRLNSSTLASIGVSPKKTTVRKELVKDAVALPNIAVKVTITPQDEFGGKLGPGFDDTVIWAVRDGGVFQHVRDEVPPPVNTDGTYTRTVVFRLGRTPTLRVSVNGVLLPKISLVSLLAGLESEA